MYASSTARDFSHSYAFMCTRRRLCNFYCVTRGRAHCSLQRTFDRYHPGNRTVRLLIMSTLDERPDKSRYFSLSLTRIIYLPCSECIGGGYRVSHRASN